MFRPYLPTTIRMRPLAGVSCVALCAGVALALSAGTGNAGTGVADASGPDTARYTILLKEQPLAAYGGGLAGFAPAPRLANGRLDVHAPAAEAYVEHLARSQAAFIGDLSSELGHRVAPIATMQHALNAVIVELDAQEAAVVAQRADVELVERAHTLPLMTDRAPAFVGAPQIWDGSATGGVSSQGEGVVVADLDTGINWRSPAFAAVDPVDGEAHYPSPS